MEQPRVFNRENLPLLDGPTEPNTCSITQAKEKEKEREGGGDLMRKWRMDLLK